MCGYVHSKINLECQAYARESLLWIAMLHELLFRDPHRKCQRLHFREEETERLNL